MRSRSLLSILLSLFLLGQNCQGAFAAKMESNLKLQNSIINASVFNSSKNDLVIENAKGLSKTVLIKALSGKLKSIKIKGSLKDGTLHVDLTQLGKANLLPKGTYQVTALRGNKKLNAQFELNPPTLYASMVSVPISTLSNKTKERILRYQTSLDGSEKNNDIYVDCHLYDPSNLEILGQEMKYPGTIEGDKIVADVILETTADYQKPDCGIKAEVTAYDKKEAELSCITFPKEASKEDNKVETELNNATTAAADVYLAAKSEAVTLVNSEVQPTQDKPEQKLDLLELYNKTVEKCMPLAELASDKVEEVKKAIIANTAKEIAEEFKKAVLEIIANGQNNVDEQISKLAAEKAAEFAAKCPNIANLPDKDLINPENFKNVKYHEIAGGLLDPKELGIPEDSKVLVDLFKSEGIIPGSLKLPSEEEILAAFMNGTAPIYPVDEESLVAHFEQIQTLAANIGEQVSKEIPVPPGTIFDPKQAVEAFKGSGIDNAIFTLAPTCIVEGQYDPNILSGGFNFKAEPGVIADESFTMVFSSIPLQEHDFSPGAVLPASGSTTQPLSSPPTGNFTVGPSGEHIPTDIPSGTVISEVQPLPSSQSPLVTPPSQPSTEPPPVVQPQPTHVPPPTESYPYTH